MAKTDMQLQRDIEEELGWDPKVNSAQIGVTVEGGAVSLLGSVDSYGQKWAAEDATKRVSGVRTVAHDLTVKVLADHKRSDAEVALAIQNALQQDLVLRPPLRRPSVKARLPSRASRIGITSVMPPNAQSAT